MQDVSKLMAQIEAKEEMISVLKEVVEVLKRTLERKNNPYTIDTRLYRDFDKTYTSTQMGSIINTPNSTQYTVYQAGTSSSSSDPYWKKNP